MPTFKRRVPGKPAADESAKPKVKVVARDLELPTEDTEPSTDLQEQILLPKRGPNRSAHTHEPWLVGMPCHQCQTRHSDTSRDLELPTEDTEPSTDLQEQITLMYGEPGIGKSSLLSEFPGTIFCMFDPGAKNLRLRKIPKETPAFTKWTEFVPWIPVIAKSEKYQNVVFDTGDMAYRLATVHVCEQNGWDHVSEAGFAKGYDRADEEFIKQVTKLTSAGKGVFFTSHIKSEKYERANGTTYNRLMPSLQSRPAQLIVGLSDIVAYYGYSGEERRLWIGGNDFILTKCRPEHNFLTTGGERLISIPMGDSHEEAYDNLMDAWDNQLDDPGGISRTVNPERRLKKAPFKK